ncbi:PEPxxWA-CTERM sorting domain-containing protein [Sphingopyxis sp. L1A2A]|uniref:PEPxxWA-CTERM sorting domain-containing protein n=1 Tax=Sphingopyxis sp. L1A2A TaxID=2502247 RepID=UPI0010F56FF6|nr:PEPxxWA-CTERM sorting domain-containing protein [Sphingopyxis sp. L1A2A]
MVEPMETVLFTQPFPDPLARTGVNFGGAPFGGQSGGSLRALPRLGALGGGNALQPAAGPAVASDGGILPLGRTAEATSSGADSGLAPTSSDGGSAGGVSSGGGTLPGSPGGGGTIGAGSSSGGSSGGGPALVPEPDVWAMLILGFGLIGGLLRRNRRARFGVAATAQTQL